MGWVVESAPIAAWLDTLDPENRAVVAAAIERLAEHGPALGRPTCDHVKGSAIKNLKELRPPSSSVRILFAFSSNRTALLLLGGDKQGTWKSCRSQAKFECRECGWTAHADPMLPATSPHSGMKSIGPLNQPCL